MFKQLAMALLLSTSLAQAQDPQINWSELGTVDQQVQFYGNGAHFLHPSGVEYVREGGNWMIYNPPPVGKVPEPMSVLLLGAGLVLVLRRCRDD